MLRRKLILILGGVTALTVAMALVALWPLQHLFQEMQHISTHGVMIRDLANDLQIGVSNVELELYRLRSHQTHRLDRLIDEMASLNRAAERIGDHYVMGDESIRDTYDRLGRELAEFERHVGVLGTTSDPAFADRHSIQALATAAALRADAAQIFRHASAHVESEQKAATDYFRWLVIGIALGFILVINVSIMVLLRAAGMVLRPVDRLVTASRELAKEHFDHRVDLPSGDEFGELAQAYNHLAEQLHRNEQRRMEVLQHVALTLNHELNNAMAVIELQLQLISRRSGASDSARPQLEQIQVSLKRMVGVVDSLKRVRQIVLTDYTEGVKMLDLERSTCQAVEPADRT